MNEQMKRVLEALWLGKVGRPTNSVVIPETEVAHFLIKHAELMAIHQCAYGSDCEACNIEHAMWWEWEISLAGPVRIRLQRVMRECGIPLPPSPWEEVPTNAVPTPLN